MKIRDLRRVPRILRTSTDNERYLLRDEYLKQRGLAIRALYTLPGHSGNQEILSKFPYLKPDPCDEPSLSDRDIPVLV
jgi:hypothetical protein